MVAVARVSRASVGLAAGVDPGIAAIVTAAAGVLPDGVPGGFASRLTTLLLDAPLPSVSTGRASFEAS